jgi:putative transposase
VVDDEDHLPLGRLTLTLCVDVKTRYPLGYHLGFDRYSYLATSECLYHAIQPKHARDRYGTTHEWLAYGIPQALVTDNGNDFLSQNLEDACQLLGIQIVHTPVRAPHLKPFIERLFATCNTGFFHVAPGTTFSNAVAKGDYNSHQAACVYLSQIDRAFNLFIVDVYAQSYHQGLKDTPAHQWEKATQAGFVPRLPANADELHILLGQVLHRRIRRGGIDFLYLRYNSPELLQLRLKLGDQLAKVKYHPRDLSLVYVYDPFARRYLTVPALDQTYTHRLSLWKHRQIVRQARRTAQTIDPTVLAQARRTIQAIFEAGAEQRRRHRRRHPQGIKAQLAAQELSAPPQVEPLPNHLQQRLEQNEYLALLWADQQADEASWREWELGVLDDPATG